MGIYRTHVLPRITDIAGGAKNAEQLRRRVCDGLAGEVVEIGFGSGRSVPIYPAPSPASPPSSPPTWRGSWPGAGTDSIIPIERAGLDGQSLPFADDSFDAALSCWTLCTIPDVTGRPRRAAPRAQARRDAALRRARARSGRTRATLAAPPRWVANSGAFGGCHLTRPIVDLVTEAGFTITELDVFYEQGAPKFAGADSLGVAVSP